MGRNGIVTWSPVVVSVSRPSRKKAAHKALRPSMVAFNGRRVDGTLDGHFRGDTHSLLLTMREQGHRKLQMLIDLPNKTIRRIYDGKQSFNIGSGGDECDLNCKLGTVVWEDGEVRDMDSRGFRIDWLEGTHTLNASLATRKKRTHDGRRSARSAKYRASRKAKSKRSKLSRRARRSKDGRRRQSLSKSSRRGRRENVRTIKRNAFKQK